MGGIRLIMARVHWRVLIYSLRQWNLGFLFRLGNYQLLKKDLLDRVTCTWPYKNCLLISVYSSVDNACLSYNRNSQLSKWPVFHHDVLLWIKLLRILVHKINILQYFRAMLVELSHKAVIFLQVGVACLVGLLMSGLNLCDKRKELLTNEMGASVSCHLFK
jgi:hypothetical protein